MKKTETLWPRIGSAVIILDSAGRFLLGERNKEPYKGSWVFPGGKIKPFETIVEAAKREILEETSLDIEILRQLGTFEIIDPNKEHRIIVINLAKVVGGELRPGQDISRVGFFTFMELSKLPLSPFTNKLVTHLVSVRI